MADAMMMARRILLIAGGIAFTLPAPLAAAEGRVLTVELCGGGVAHIPQDGSPPVPDHGCCAKPCHAPDPRKRGLGGCCGGGDDRPGD